MKWSLRLLYLYLFSFVGLLITIIGSIQLVDLTLKSYVFKVSDYTYFAEPIKLDGAREITVEEQQKRSEMEQINQRKRQLSTALAMIVIGAPVYIYHWKTIKKEAK